MVSAEARAAKKLRDSLPNFMADNYTGEVTGSAFL
jgi:hypothetical protein